MITQDTESGIKNAQDRKYNDFRRKWYIHIGLTEVETAQKVLSPENQTRRPELIKEKNYFESNLR